MINNILNIFKERKGEPIEERRKAAVMILLVEENEELKLVFEVRSSKLRSQPGDICLPGGKVENQETPKDTAIRETCEELGIIKEKLKLLGEMDYLITPYGLTLYSYVGQISLKDVVINKDEVDHIFTVPLKYFMENEPFLYEMRIGPINNKDFPFELINNNTDYKFKNGILKEYFYKYNEYSIWGYTAIIIKRFVDLLRD